MHAIIVVSKNSNGNYIAVDPAKGMAFYSFNISSAGVVSGNVTYGSGGCAIDFVEQYSLSNPVTPSYLSKCTFYPSFATGVIKNSTWLKLFPCSGETDASSTNVVNSALAVGTKISISGIYKNTVGNYWYKAKLTSGSNSGKEGYLFAGDVTTTLSNNTVTYSGKAFPTSMTVGNTYAVDWTIKSTNLPIKEIHGYIYGGSNLTEQKYTGAVTNLNTNSYGLSNSAVDNALLYNKLSAGTFKTEITATTQNFYSSDGKSLSLRTDTATPISFTFSEVSSGTKSYYLDLNGYIDGSTAGNIGSAGRADVYINGNPEAKNVTDYYKAWPTGTRYEIRNIRGFGYKYDGTQSGSLSGTIGSSDVAIVLSFSKIPQNTSPASGTEYNNHRYERYDYHLTWTEAKAFCEEKGGHLVTIDDENEQQAVFFVLEGCPFGVYYIGGTDPDQSGNWTWVTGESFSYENWDMDSPEPSLGDSEYYSAIIGIDNPPNKQIGEWIDCPNVIEQSGDFYSKINTGFVCEYDPPQEYTITYDANGGEGAPESVTSIKDYSITISESIPTRADSAAGSFTVTLDANGGSVSPSSLTALRTNSYTFKNWNTKADGSGTNYNPGASYTPDADVTLYAQWTISTTIGTVSLPTPTREEYIFMGWAINRTADTGITGVYTPNGNTTLYAIWKEDPGIPVDEAHFPDAYFRSYVSSTFDTDSDGVLSKEERFKVTSISIMFETVSSFEGIRYFPALQSLRSYNNGLSGLDVSHNPALTELFCFGERKLTSLDVSQNTALTSLKCIGCFNLQELDLSYNTALTTLDFSGTKLTNLDLSKNVALKSLACSQLGLISLDIRHNTALQALDCSDNQLTSLDLSQNTALKELNCKENKLAVLDLCNNTALVDLNCSQNDLTSLNISRNAAITELICWGNKLTALDVSMNPGLKCLSCDSNEMTTLDISKCPTLIEVFHSGTLSTENTKSEFGNKVFTHYRHYETSKSYYLEFDNKVTLVANGETLYAVWMYPDFVLPTALTTIEQEAFVGGAFSCVKLPETVTTIGSRAFADCPNLAYIYIPEATTSIASDAFSGVTGLTVFGAEDSYAAFYAQRHGFTFIAD